ncbi:uncharacterized protein C6orf118 homolog [Petromyzon marinus]|uniref:Uncharacterized protein C6orf118 homolog n=1 Tax=Petromyzon marinus TaxID=7757 RepID=A0AAJ7XCI4_PETMA|nr:uncharacterized protein C6orf118 homolog [Petromyzon marinus]
MGPAGRASLRRLLDRTEAAHRAAVATFTRGHLNPDRVLRAAPPGAAPVRLGWASARPGAAPRSRGVRGALGVRVDQEARVAAMTERLASLTLGAGAMRGLTRVRSESGPPASPVVDPGQETAESADRGRPGGRGGGGAERSRESLEGARGEGAPGGAPPELVLGGVTWRDRYRSLRKVDTNLFGASGRAVVARPGAGRRRARPLAAAPGAGATARPSWRRLQERRSALQAVVHHSTALGHIIGDIMREYDEYLAVLMDAHQGVEYEALMAQLRCVGEGQDAELRGAERELWDLETQARAALTRNERLRVQLREQDREPPTAETPVLTPEPPPQPPRTPVPPRAPSAASRVRTLHAELADATLALGGVRARRQQQLVPSTETQLLGQRVRDMRVEAARLARSTQRLDKSAQKQERELLRILARYKIPPEAQGELWRAINDGARTPLPRDADHPRGSLDPPPPTTTTRW